MTAWMEQPAFLVVLTAGLIAAVTDLWKFRVYNWLTWPLMATGLIFQTWTNGWDGLGGAALGMGVSFAVLLVVYAAGAMGAGDVKLMAGVGAWLGWPLTLYVLLASCIAGGVWGAVILITRRLRSQAKLDFSAMTA